MAKATDPAFVLVDGDDVGEKIESLIVRGDVAALLRFTQEIDRAVARIATMMRQSGGTVHMAGGDNVLAQVPDATAFLDHFAATRAAFCVTFSAGVGASAREAHAALKTAKEAAPGAIVRAERSSKRVEFRRRTVKGTWVALG